MQNGFLQTSDFSDDDLNEILGLGGVDNQQSRLQLQQKLANALRTKGTEKGQSVPMGSVFLPPSPLTTAMDTFDHLQGITSAMQGEEKGKDLDAKHAKGLARFAKLWFKNKQDQGTDPLDPNDPDSLIGPPESQSQSDDNEDVPQQ
jgi:hypothetical protein